MINLNEAELTELIIHYVGNKSNDDKLILSSSCVIMDDLIMNLLSRYFLRPFNTNECYNFYHELGLSYNCVYSELRKFFNSQISFVDFSSSMAIHLFNASTHPNIKPGEFYVAQLINFSIEGKKVNGVGFFKSENRETYLRVFHKSDGFGLQTESGLNINGLDKGCIVLNTREDSGYVAYMVDKTNKSNEAKYWSGDFLNLRRVNDSYTQTQNVLAMCKSFIDQLPKDVAKAEKAVMMNRIMEGVKTDKVNIDELASFAFGNASSNFKNFKEGYQSAHEVRFDETFQGHPETINRRAVSTITTIKLDSNFNVNIYGGEQLIERGYDKEKGMNYYKLYFNEEK